MASQSTQERKLHDCALLCFMLLVVYLVLVQVLVLNLTELVLTKEIKYSVFCCRAMGKCVFCSVPFIVWCDTGDSIPPCFTPQFGVRQGGELSPVLFAVYVHSLAEMLCQSGYGCYVDSLFVGCVIYFDDLVLLSASIHKLQLMVEICCSEADTSKCYGVCRFVS